MRVIDLLNKIANNEEVPKEVRYKTHYWKYNKERNDYRDEDDDYVFTCSNYAIVDMLDEEIEIIKEETTHEQNFTGWQIVQNGKVVASYNYNGPTSKKVDVVDVEKDIKEMLKEKPKKIEDLRKEMFKLQSEIDLLSNEIGHLHNEAHSMRDRNNYMKETLKDLLKTANYLLEKESDK